MAGELIPMVLFVVIGFITIGFFHFNSKNRQSIMDTVQKPLIRLVERHQAASR